MALGLWLIGGIAALLLVVGLTLFTRGVARKLQEPGAEAEKGWKYYLFEYFGKAFKIIFAKDSSKADVLMASGILVMLLAILVALVGIPSVLVAAGGGGGAGSGGTPTTTPTPTSSSPAPTT